MHVPNPAIELSQTMRKVSLVFVVGIGGVSILSWIILQNCHRLPLPRCNAASSAQADTTATTSDSQLATNYFVYSPKAVQDAHDTGAKVVLYFWAPWCASCASLDVELIDGTATLPENVVLLRIPFDTSQELRRKYAVTIQHTFIQVAPDGSVITKWIGGETEAFSTFLK